MAKTKKDKDYTKSYHKNPRYITKSQRESLHETLGRLGDISGIVENVRTNELISGNQRGDLMDINDCTIEITHESKEPDAQGTLKIGFVMWRGSRYNYRLVDWDERTCEEANILANKAGGNWDFDILANEFQTEDLLDWGFNNWDFGFGKKEQDEAKPIDRTVNTGEVEVETEHEQQETESESESESEQENETLQPKVELPRNPSVGSSNIGERKEEEFVDEVIMKLVFSLAEYEFVKSKFAMLSVSSESALLMFLKYETNGQSSDDNE
jgi:hypothetical protein